MTPDWLLLRRYAQENSQDAFAALTARYLNLVYSVCLREVHDPEMAQDVTQAVFLLLARTAPAFRSKTGLPGWLFRTARFAARNARKREQRRRHYEEKAAQAMQQQDKGAGDAAWSEIEPLLNQSLAALKEGERQCVLLRFFQGMSFTETGTTLGLSEEAARKRVTRALEKMRAFFEKGGVIVPGVAFAALLSAHAAKAAPAPLGAAVSQSVAGVITGSVSLLLKGVLHAMKIAQLKTAGAAAVALLVLAVYPILTHARSAGGIKSPIVRQATPVASPTPTSPTVFLKNATLTGRVVYADGRPAPGVDVVAGLQDKAEADLNRRTPESSWDAISAISGMGDVTKADGSYRFEVAPNLPYNVMVELAKRGAEDDRTVGWVAAADEGMVGKANKTTPLPDLVLTRGVFVTGLVTDKASGRPLMGVHVGSHGPHRPFTTGMIIVTETDRGGHYRLRLAPGKGEVYIADGRYNGFFDEEARAKKLIVPVTTSKGHPATVDFQVTLSPPKP
jgi:RNA polymerase sigma factor (sigma-70 family)